MLARHATDRTEIKGARRLKQQLKLVEMLATMLKLPVRFTLGALTALLAGNLWPASPAEAELSLAMNASPES